MPSAICFYWFPKSGSSINVIIRNWVIFLGRPSTRYRSTISSRSYVHWHSSVETIPPESPALLTDGALCITQVMLQPIPSSVWGARRRQRQAWHNVVTAGYTLSSDRKHLYEAESPYYLVLSINTSVIILCLSELVKCAIIVQRLLVILQC